MSTFSAIANSGANDEGLGSFDEQLSAAGGIHAFYGPESSQALASSGGGSSNSSANITSAIPTTQEGPPPYSQLYNTTSRSPTVDTLEFLEFISKNGVRIIPYHELEIDPTRGTIDANFANDITLLQGANMKVVPGKWHTDEEPRNKAIDLIKDGCIPVALKVFKKAPVPAATFDEAGLRSALDGCEQGKR